MTTAAANTNEPHPGSLIGTVWDAALVVDYLNEKGNSDLAYRASHPLLGDLKRAREILSSIWDEAMKKEVAK
jgi:hypothetical protein